VLKHQAACTQLALRIIDVVVSNFFPEEVSACQQPLSVPSAIESLQRLFVARTLLFSFFVGKVQLHYQKKM
jgi:hypothetical protein